MKKYLLLVIGFVLVLLAPASAWAGSLSIQPLRQELELAPGQAFSNQLLVSNNSNQPALVKLSAESFGVINENYDYSFTKTEGAQDWVSFDKPQIQLKPGETGSSAYSLGVPNYTEPGEKYIVLFASIENKSSGSINSIDRLGLLLYITVKGNVTKQGKTLDTKFPSATLTRQAHWSIRLQNYGSAHFSSKVAITVTNIFGQTIGTTTTEHLILPATVRYLDGNIGLGSLPGIYKARVLVGQGDNPANNQTKWIVYMPIWSIVFLAIALAVAGRQVKKKLIGRKIKFRD